MACDNICVYIAFSNEVSCEKIINTALKDNKHVFVPVVDINTKTMEFYQINMNTKWNNNKYGIKEPVIKADTEKLNPMIQALCLMPGVAFDKDKHRIGYGGGYYDKYLSDKDNYITMALCYDFQIIDTDIPINELDISPQYIATEEGIM